MISRALENRPTLYIYIYMKRYDSPKPFHSHNKTLNLLLDAQMIILCQTGFGNEFRGRFYLSIFMDYFTPYALNKFHDISR
jgi:hypothetical protein